MAFGALLIAIIAVAPATANNGAVRHRIARVTQSKLRSPVQSGVIAVGSEVKVLDIGAGVTAISRCAYAASQGCRLMRRPVRHGYREFREDGDPTPE
jgi:hypothetical protein